MANIRTTTTPQPATQVELKKRKRLSEDDWSTLSVDLDNTTQQALADRSTLDQNLRDWDELYEQITSEKDFPWQNAANIFVPLIATQLDSLIAYISGQVLVPRLILVTGLTPQASENSHLVERYYNAEMKRLRGDATWFEAMYQWLQLSARDGTAFIEALWKYRKTKIKAVDHQPRMKEDPETGIQQQDVDEMGMPIYDRVPIEIEDTYNDVELKPVELRNLYTIPAAATSIQAAMAVVKVEYLYEDQLNELVREDILDKDEVERALSFVPIGVTELPSSQQPLETYTAGLQLSLGGGQGTVASTFFKNRGPIEVYRIHSRQYDLDGDGTPEENVFWFHPQSIRMLGWMRYEYLNGLRPFFPFSPFPRANRLIGFSLVERLAGLQNEVNALRNQRLDEATLRLSPPFVTDRNTFIDGTTMAWGPNEMNEVSVPPGMQPKDVIQRMDLGTTPPETFGEERNIKQDAQEFTGLTNPMIGQQMGGRRSAAEARQWQAAAMTRTGLLAIRFRMAIRPLINFVHQLKKQYLTSDQQFVDNGQRFSVPLPILQQDFQIDISGATDPVDANMRRELTMAALQMFMQFPIIGQNLMHQHYLLRKGLEVLDWDVDADKIIGTEEELQQMMQQQQQMAAMGQGQPPGGQQPPGGKKPGGGGGAPGGGAPPASNPLG